MLPSRQRDLMVVLLLLLCALMAYPALRRAYSAWQVTAPNHVLAADHAARLVSEGPRGIRALEKIVRTSHLPSARRVAFEALAPRSEEAVTFVDESVLRLAMDIAASDWDMELQNIALHKLADAGEGEARPIALALLHDPDPAIRGPAARLLRLTVEDDDLATFLALAHDSEPQVWHEAVYALSDMTTVALEVPIGETPDARAARAQAIASWKARVIPDGPARSLPAETPARPLATTPIPRPMASKFAFSGINRANLELRDLRGKPVLVNFWATWCAPCIQETPDLQALHEKVGDNAVVLGVAADFKNDGPAISAIRGQGGEVTPENIASIQAHTIRSFIDRFKLTYPMVDGTAEAIDTFDAYALPTTIVITPDGHIHRRIIGARKEDVFASVLLQAGRDES